MQLVWCLSIYGLYIRDVFPFALRSIGTLVAHAHRAERSEEATRRRHKSSECGTTYTLFSVRNHATLVWNGKRSQRVAYIRYHPIYAASSSWAHGERLGQIYSSAKIPITGGIIHTHICMHACACAEWPWIAALTVDRCCIRGAGRGPHRLDFRDSAIPIALFVLCARLSL